MCDFLVEKYELEFPFSKKNKDLILTNYSIKKIHHLFLEFLVGRGGEGLNIINTQCYISKLRKGSQNKTPRTEQ